MATKNDRRSAWDALPESATAIAWGTTWANSNRSAIAIVPSVVVPEEWNVLINPRHPDAAKLKAAVARRWAYDPRLTTAAPHEAM